MIIHSHLMYTFLLRFQQLRRQDCLSLSLFLYIYIYVYIL